MIDEKGLAEIDKHQLDEEFVNQPKLYEEYALQLEEARADVDEAKNSLKVKEDDYDVAWAQVDLEVRKNPEFFGFDKKLTEGCVRSAVITSKEVEKARLAIGAAREEIVRLQRISGALSAAVIALDHRKKSLEKLCDLRLSNYYSEPRIPKGKGEFKSDVIDGKRKKMYNESRKSDNKKEVVDD